ncbi:MAG: hypothetical protein HYS06_07220 [Methylocystis sp.]|nr:hypothetical protein [Methylocystis sp.]
MFDHSSRYYALAVASFILPDGHEVSYVRRRFLPRGDDAPLLAEIAVAPEERIDLVANRIYGDPLAFWRICDANDAMDPLEMLRDAAGDPTRRLRAPTPQA